MCSTIDFRCQAQKVFKLYSRTKPSDETSDDIHGQCLEKELLPFVNVGKFTLRDGLAYLLTKRLPTYICLFRQRQREKDGSFILD